VGIFHSPLFIASIEFSSIYGMIRRRAWALAREARLGPLLLTKTTAALSGTPRATWLLAHEGTGARSLAVRAVPGPSLGEGTAAFREIKTAGYNRDKWDVMGRDIDELA
jgi:hypothetical protein